MANSGKLVVFNLPSDVRDQDLEDIFGKFGKLTRSQVRNMRGSEMMAFVEFDDPRDAEEAKHERHGYNFDGKHIRVEWSQRGPPGGGDKGGRGGSRRDSRRRDSRRGRRNDSRRGRGGGRRDSRGRGGRGGGKSGGGKGAPYFPTDRYHKVKIIGLPHSASWQDLKDFLRQAGNVRFTEIEDKDRGIGIGGFSSQEEVERCIRELDDAKFKARNGDSVHVRLELEDGPSGKGGSRSRSRGGRKSRSPSRAKSSRAKSGSRSRSR